MLTKPLTELSELNGGSGLVLKGEGGKNYMYTLFDMPLSRAPYSQRSYPSS